MADDKNNTPNVDKPDDVPAPSKSDPPVSDKSSPQPALFETGKTIPNSADMGIPSASEQKIPAKPEAPTVDEKAPAAGKVVDFSAARDEAAKTTLPKKGAPVSDKAAKKASKTQEAAKPRKGRPVKADKAAPDEAQPPKARDKMSQSQKAAKAAPEAVKVLEPEQPPAPLDATRAEKEEIVYLNLSELHAFKGHPFGVRDDAEMRSLVESVKAGGVNQPALVRPREGGGYEIIAGHRRQKASELAGYANMPCIVRNMTDDEAILAMTDDNLRQRSEILPTEKAQSLKMQVEAIKHQGARVMGNLDGTDAGKRSTEIVGERNGINYKQVQRYIRLTELVPELQKMVDEKGLAFTPAVEISFIRPKYQKYIAVSIEGQQSTPSLSQAQQLRKLDKENKLNPDVIDGILSQEKKKEDRNVIINGAELEKYFGKEATPRQMKDQIMTLLNEWKEKQPPELAKPEKKADLEK